ncbi:MAG: hypothetical protein IT497_08010 [Ottowia sp.]|jgi:hypothetical protein|nr:hypothetical protein [Ottowia sp.]
MAKITRPQNTRKKEVQNHYADPLSTEPHHIGGRSRNASDASTAIKNIVITEIQRAAKNHGLSRQETAHLIAFADAESGFNPDAAAKSIKKTPNGPDTSASGVFQITDETADDAIRLTNVGKVWVRGIKLDIYDRFHYVSNIQYGIVVYLDKKRRAKFSDDILKIYEYWHSEIKFYQKDGTLITPLRPAIQAIFNKLKKSEHYLKKLQGGELITFNDIDQRGVVVIKESKTGRNELFFDTRSGRTLSREDFVAAILAGDYPGYRVSLIKGLPTPISKPDNSAANNLG